MTFRSYPLCFIIAKGLEKELKLGKTKPKSGEKTYLINQPGQYLCLLGRDAAIAWSRCSNCLVAMQQLLSRDAANYGTC